MFVSGKPVCLPDILWILPGMVFLVTVFDSIASALVFFACQPARHFDGAGRFALSGNCAHGRSRKNRLAGELSLPHAADLLPYPAA